MDPSISSRAKYPADATNYREMLHKACEDMGVEMDELLGEEKPRFKKAA